MSQFVFKMKRMIQFRASFILICVVLASTNVQSQNKKLVVSSWGGAYETAQLSTYFEPFQESTGITIELKRYAGGLAALEEETEFNSGTFDVIDMNESDALKACENNLLVDFGSEHLVPAPDGLSAEQDFYKGSIFECGVAHLESAIVLAYDNRAFPQIKPNSIEDFFDIERFPGKRAVQRQPKVILEWAMLSYGVPLEQLYDLLSTERGLSLVTKRLNRIRNHIVWWNEPSEPVRMLADGEVVMASGFNGRFFDARVHQGIPISIVRDAQILEKYAWVIPNQSSHQEEALQFIAFATKTENMATFSNLLPYSPTRKSVHERIGLHLETNTSMHDYLPASASNQNRLIRADSRWYSHTEEIRQRWFNDWLDDD